MTEILVNLNEDIEVELTKEGLEYVKEYMENYKIKPETYQVYFKEHDINKRVMAVPMHELFNIFGSIIRMGKISPFKNNTIKIITK